MILIDLTSAWEAAVQRALAARPSDTELSARQLVAAAGLRLHTNLRAGDDDFPQASALTVGNQCPSKGWDICSYKQRACTLSAI